MPVSLPLSEVTLEEKLQVMEALWDDLSRDPEALKSPAWHEDVLREREERLAAGEADFVDWEQAKTDIRGQGTAEKRAL
jgi:putative addiction module component